MVLDAGRIVSLVTRPLLPSSVHLLIIFPQVEFDKPSELLKREGSLLRALVEESGDKEALVDIASGTMGLKL